MIFLVEQKSQEEITVRKNRQMILKYKYSFLISLFFLLGCGFIRAQETHDEMYWAKWCLSGGLYDNEVPYQNKVLKVYSIIKNDDVKILIVGPSSNNGFFTEISFGKSEDETSQVLVGLCIVDSKGNFKEFFYGTPAGNLAIKEIKKLLKLKPHRYLIDKKMICNVTVSPTEGTGNDLVWNSVKYIYENKSTYPDRLAPIGPTECGGSNRRLIFYDPSTSLSEEGGKKEIMAFLSLYIDEGLPGAVKQNSGTFWAFKKTEKEGERGKLVLFAGIETTDKTNKKFEVLNSEKYQRIGDEKKIKQMVSRLLTFKPAECEINRTVDNQIELKPCSQGKK